MIKNKILKTKLIDWHKADWLQDGLKVATPDNLTKLKNSIKANQFIMPFTVWEENKNKLWILDGHHRKLALEELEKEGTQIPQQLPANFVQCKNKKEAYKLVLLYSSLYAEIANKGLEDFLANSKLTLEELTNEIALPGIDLISYFKQNLTDEQLDEIPEVQKKAIAKTGDLFLLNCRHRVLCGDSTKKEDVDTLMGGGRIKMLFTSPPYNMASALYENYEDNLKSEEFIKFNLDVLKFFVVHLSGFVFWNLSYNKNSRWEFIEIFHRMIKETGLKFLELIVWNKKHGLPITSKEMLTRQYEDILFIGDEASIHEDLELFYVGRNDKRAWFNKKNQKGITNYWEVGTNKIQLENHSACYPVILPAKGIYLTTGINEIVADPFLGSGSTLIACEQTNRICYGMEIDPIYIDVILRRYHKLYPDAKIECLNRKFDFDKLWQS